MRNRHSANMESRRGSLRSGTWRAFLFLPIMILLAACGQSSAPPTEVPATASMTPVSPTPTATFTPTATLTPPPTIRPSPTLALPVARGTDLPNPTTPIDARNAYWVEELGRWGVTERDAGQAAFSPDGELIAIGDWEGTVHLLRSTNGQLVKTLDGLENHRVLELNLDPMVLPWQQD